MSLNGPDMPEVSRGPSAARWLDFVLAICALFTSAVSIYMAYHNGQDMERLVHANSWPFLQMDSGNFDEVRDTPVIAFTVKNAGTGPARLHTMEFLFDGRPVQEGFVWDQIAQSCCAAERQSAFDAAAGDGLVAYGAITTSAPAPGFLAPGDEVNILAWPRTEQNKTLWHAMDLARQHRRIATRACFCSVFDECWVAQTDAFPPRPVASCTESAQSTPG